MTEEHQREWSLPAFADSRCRSCSAVVRWCITESGKRMPINRDGKSHFATCPQADRWRK